MSQNNLRMIHTYADFCKYHDQGNIRPDLTSHLGRKSLNRLKEMGWHIGYWRPQTDFLRICRSSDENFQTAYQTAGIDFWVRE
ncbi:MAG: hypothetical protein CMF04_14495 [Hyphomonas sp.]|nr:hypothetical protein [Hyphomonas sp.]